MKVNVKVNYTQGKSGNMDPMEDQDDSMSGGIQDAIEGVNQDEDMLNQTLEQQQIREIANQMEEDRMQDKLSNFGKG